MDASVLHAPAGVAARRLGWALSLSVLLHFALIVFLHAGLPVTTGRPAVSIEARIASPEPAAAAEAVLPRAEPLAEQIKSTDGTPSGVATAAPERPAASSAAEGAAHLGTAAPSASAGVPAADDASYYAVTALDRPPMPLAPPHPCYPAGASGEVGYELLIDEHGIVNRAAVVSVHPLGLFTGAAEQLCAALRFAPAIKGGRAVRSKVRMVVGPR